jgi:hypothetical protein
VLVLLLVAQATGVLDSAPAAPRPGPDSTPDSTYATPALRALVGRAAARNATVPRGLRSYRVRIESELSVLIRRPDGTEGATQIEQVESVAQWDRTGAFTQHVIGYRSRLSGINISALTLIKQAWAVPVLYGNRLGLFLGRDTGHVARRAIARDTGVRVFHPLAAYRDSVYRFSGGDTALTVRAGDHTIPVAVVHVVPRTHLRRRTVVFRGDLYLDVDRATLVRMRGAFEAVGGHASFGARIQEIAVQGVAFVDLTDREVEGRYWLPAAQRIEGQASSPLTGDTRSVFRVVSRFGDYTLNDTATGPVPGPLAASAPTGPAVAPADSTARDTTPPADTLRALPHRLTFAPSDSVSGFSGWTAPIGTATTTVRADDFKDVAPGAWRLTGPPILEPGTRRITDFLRFDRVEGLFTGFGTSLRFRDAAPGLTARARAGWAWREGTVRGGVGAEWLHEASILGIDVSRSLATTNDFRTLFSSGPFLESLIVQDDYDYVDRRSATVYAAHDWLDPGAGPGFVVRAEGGVGDDRGDRARLTHGLLPSRVLMSDSLFRPNRNVLPGTYARGAVTVDIHPGVDAGFVRQGVGARLHYELAGGDIGWQRAEVRLVADHTWGPFTVVGRADGGIVAGQVIPPQQLFEIGSTEGLLAYDYKEFAGDRAAVWRGEALYALPFWEAPLRIGGFILPSPSPAIAVGFQSGWADASTPAARRALIALGSRVDPATNIVLRDSTGVPIPVSRPTNGVRTSINIILRFLGGAAGIGIARALDRGASWQPVVRIGAAL